MDPNTKTGINRGRGVQQVSPKKQKYKNNKINSSSPEEGGVGAFHDGAWRYNYNNRVWDLLG